MNETKKMHVIPSCVVSPSGKHVNCHIEFDVTVTSLEPCHRVTGFTCVKEDLNQPKNPYFNRTQVISNSFHVLFFS